MSDPNPFDSGGNSSTENSDRWSQEPNAKPHPATDAFAHLRRHFHELLAYINHYATAKRDAVKVSVQKAVLWTIIGALAVLGAVAILVTACVLLLCGIAGGISVLFGRGNWLGDLIVGAVIVGVIALALWQGIGKFRAIKRMQLVQDYERRQQQQRSEFGHDAKERAEQAARDR